MISNTAEVPTLAGAFINVDTIKRPTDIRNRRSKVRQSKMTREIEEHCSPRGHKREVFDSVYSHNILILL